MKLSLDLPRRKDLRGDRAAGLTNGLVQIPDAMASAILAPVRPVNGLNTLIIGTPVVALIAGSVFMTVTTTGAISLAVADALAGSDGGEHMGDQLQRAGLAVLLGRDNIFPAQSLVYGSTEEAYEASRLRLKEREAD